MKPLGSPFSASLILLTVAGVFTLAESARADGTEPRRAAGALETLLAFPAETEAPLPTRLDSWTEEDLRLDDALPLTFGSYPQGRLSQKPPFIDFSRFEMGAFMGLVDYSSAFRANPNWVGGVTARVPVPGLPLGEWGLWAELFMSYVSRSLPFFYKDQAAAWYGGAVGGDYTVVHTDVWYLRGQLGVMYAFWNGVNSLDNGMGIMGGVQVGFNWIKGNSKTVITITPQFSYDGDAWIAFITAGFSIDF